MCHPMYAHINMRGPGAKIWKTIAIAEGVKNTRPRIIPRACRNVGRPLTTVAPASLRFSTAAMSYELRSGSDTYSQVDLRDDSRPRPIGPRRRSASLDSVETWGSPEGVPADIEPPDC